MKYFVKNADGELTFANIHELRAMFDHGLVGEDDEVRPEDSTVWRKASAIPELRAFSASKREGGQFRFVLVTLLCLSGALMVLFGKSGLSKVTRVLFAATLMIPVIGMSQRAFTKAIKRKDR